ncbi:MAG TPA: hypothetical protein DG753_06700 [Clostridium sp.]|nr:hypothetical protein [Clostridium sp.]
MKNNKIAFITCVNDDTLYDECLRYINNLEIPEGYEIDIISVREAESITSAYNNAMNSTDAKYKVYLHQDTLIVNKDFIKNIIDIFNLDEKIGMIGMVGAKNIPTNAYWWDDDEKYGKVYDSHIGSIQRLYFNEIDGRYEQVKAIDGFIMITQYDVKWRDDLFDGWHFYDISQSVEFNNKGYKVVIPNQEKFWCVHDCGLINASDIYIEKYRKIFIEEYSRHIFPLVSILIPTYNRPEYFELALQSAINQTYPNIEIIIGDDSTNSDTEEIINNKYINKVDNIKYYHNSKNIGQFDNDLKLMELANGEYINFLMDDDLFEPTKIEKMIKYFINDSQDEISLVTSHRGIIDSNGEFKGIFRNTENLINKDTMLNGDECGNFALINNFNFLGEPTTVLFKKSKLSEPFGVFNGREYGCNVDMATWLNLLSSGKAVFINEVLSYFRMFEGQQSSSSKMKILGATDYIHEVLTSRQKKFLIDDDEYLQALSNCKKYCEYIFEKLEDEIVESDLNDYIILQKQYNILKIKYHKMINEDNYLEKYINKECNSKKITFIVYGDNKKCIKGLQKLSIPEGYEVNIMPIKEQNSIARAYNNAMRVCDSKYKIYINSNTYIVNKNFISEVISLFESDDEIGMIGMIGAKNILADGTWKNSVNSYGKVYINNDQIINYNEVEKEYEQVQIIDGFLMATQYDIPWRSDKFKGGSFYDISQSIEFNLNNKKIIIPKQDEPWCVCDKSLLDNKGDFELYKSVFLNEYSKKIFPLVSILIPTHNRTEFFRIALESAINQTYKNIEIIVSDNSDTFDTKDMMQEYLNRYDNIIYTYESGLNIKENWNTCLKQAKGEYINYLMDDDIFEYTKIEKMMNYYIEYPQLSVVTSYRKIIDAYGNSLPDIPATRKMFETDTIVPGKEMSKFVLYNLINCIGEPTTVLYKKKYYSELSLKLNGQDLRCNLDIARSLIALKEGDCAYISQPLSYFRIHDEQDQKDMSVRNNGIIEWYNIIFDFYKNNCVYDDKNEFMQSLALWCKIAMNEILNLRNSDMNSKVQINNILKESLKNILDL